MEPEELQERLGKILERNGPENCHGTMPDDLKEAFSDFITSCGIEFASADSSSKVPLPVVIAATLTQGFWLGHDYALEYGQLRGN